MKFFKKFKRRVNITALSSHSLMVFNEHYDATEEEDELSYTEYREELLEYSANL